MNADTASWLYTPISIIGTLPTQALGRSGPGYWRLSNEGLVNTVQKKETDQHVVFVFTGDLYVCSPLDLPHRC